MLETWILVIDIIGGFMVGERNESSRTRDLPHDACLILVQEVRSEKTISYCYPTDTLDPRWWPSSRKGPATFTLNVTYREGIGLRRTWTPNLSEAECRARAAQIDGAQGWADCSRSIEPSPPPIRDGPLPGRKRI